MEPARPDAVPEHATLAHLLRWRALHQPERLGYRFLADGESREETLTYGELDRRARGIAARLSALGAAGRPVLLVYPPGLELVCAWFGCAYAGAVAVAVPPPRAAGAGGRILADAGAIAADARPAAAATTAAILAGPAAAPPPGPLGALRWLASDGPEPEPPPLADEPAVGGGDLALLQYTSGSTTAPRGVAVSHGNLMHNLRAIAEAFWRSGDRGSVCWLPPYHDMGLIGGILGPLYVGSPVTLLPPLSFVQRPRRWLQAIARFDGAVSGGPNFAYDLCVRRIPPAQLDGLDLSGWRVAFNGAEPIDPRTVREFTAHFAPCGFDPAAFTPCYGLAEATLLAAVDATPGPPRIGRFRASALERHRVVPYAEGADRAGAADARELVSCGRPVAAAAIVDPRSSRRRPPGRVGEIWLAGPGVAAGYWRRRADSERTFGARLADGGDDGDNGGGDGGVRYLRTGDLGFLLDGELYVTGRLKDLILVDGANHYPQDVERTVGGCHPELTAADCAAFPVEVDGREAAVVVAGVRRPGRAAAAELVPAIRAAVAGRHGLRLHDAVVVERGRLARTASGKLRRHACRAAYLAGELEAREEGDPA